MRISEVAAILRVSPRTLRHYESLGLLRPASVDPATGYRTYSGAEVRRGVRIEQLKATGLPLDDIAAVLDLGADWQATLAEQRRRVCAEVRDSRRRLAVIDALADASSAPADPVLVDLDPTEVVVRHATCDPDDLAVVIRRLVQRLRRHLGHGGCAAQSGVFSARFPLDLEDEPIEVEVAAHLTGAAPGSITWPAARAVCVTVVGPLALLPAAYHAAISAAEDRNLTLAGDVRETYLDIARAGRTIVALPVRS